MENRWIEHPDTDQDKIDRLCHDLNIDPILSSLLIRRGIETFDDAKRFFRPSLADLHNPFLMRDMDRAIARIEKAIQSQERILIYGDYDVDGTTAVAVVYGFFKTFYSSVSFYVPDRYVEGYGISMQGIHWAKEQDYSLIIALDCGIKAVEAVAYARSLGIDFIIGDHHTPGAILPDAIAVLDPKRSDCSYPYKELSGCGIGFKIIQAFSQKRGLPMEGIIPYLDRVAVSIAADIVPITGENRVLAFYGLETLNKKPCAGLQTLKKLSTQRSEYGIEDIVFQIGPRINAAGRIHHAHDAVRLLIASTEQEAETFGLRVDSQNIERKEHDARITEEALGMIEKDTRLIGRKSTVVFQHHWHKGVIGIVASRLIERYYRPTVVLTRSNGHVTGSARSISGFDLYEALNECSDLLVQFGGHKYAAGLTLQEENLIAFQDRFEEVVAKRITPESLQQEILIDSEIALTHLKGKFLRIIKQFAPFGPQNTAPIFLSRSVAAVGVASVVGKNHLKMNVRQSNSPIFTCIGFRLGEYVSHINRGLPFDMCYQVEENVWRDQRRIQLNIKDIRFNPW